MLVGMARGAFPAQSEEGTVQIPHLDRRPRGTSVLCVVAAFAFLLAMFPFEPEAGLRFVVEGIASKPDKRERPAVMLHMAPGTIGLASRSFDRARVKACLRIQPGADFRMALHAFEASRPGAEVVARSAFRNTLQLLMRR
jgi:hypothetical protein